VDARVERAHRAFAAWRAVAPGDRARLLRRFADAVDADI
jgi:acyl-CoA reductase-like NAD-dependent aldehyde dehydrogenase